MRGRGGIHATPTVFLVEYLPSTKHPAGPETDSMFESTACGSENQASDSVFVELCGWLEILKIKYVSAQSIHAQHVRRSRQIRPVT